MPPEYAAMFTFCAATSGRAAEVQHKMSEQYKRPVFPDYPFLVTMVRLIISEDVLNFFIYAFLSRDDNNTCRVNKFRSTAWTGQTFTTHTTLTTEQTQYQRTTNILPQR